MLIIFDDYGIENSNSANISYLLTWAVQVWVWYLQNVDPMYEKSSTFLVDEQTNIIFTSSDFAQIILKAS